MSKTPFETILSELTDRYTLNHDDREVTGQSISFLVQNTPRSVLPANLVDAENRLEEMGFAVVDGRNSRNQKTRVVTKGIWEEVT